MKDYLLKLFNYNHWSNEALLETVEKNKINDEYVLKMLSHTMYIQRKRYNQLVGANYVEIDLWDTHTVEILKTHNDALTELYIKLISKMSLSNLNEKIETKAINGEVFYMSITDILIHVANHSSHHRGQVSLRIKELGHVPPEYSYLYYCKCFPDFW